MYRLPALLVAGLVLLAGCSAPFAATSTATDGGVGLPQVTDDDAPTTNETTIAVSATGEVTAAPDLAVVAFAVTATADTADAARGDVAADAERVRTALRDAGIPDDAVRTTYFAVTPEYDYSDRERELIGYRAVHAYAVETDPGNAGSVVDLVLGNGADEVHGVTFDLADETRAELRTEALERAVAAARSDADAVAGAAGLSVTGVHAIDVNDAGRPVPVFAARSEAAGDAATTLDPAPVTVSASVRVTYTAA